MFLVSAHTRAHKHIRHPFNLKSLLNVYRLSNNWPNSTRHSSETLKELIYPKRISIPNPVRFVFVRVYVCECVECIGGGCIFRIHTAILSTFLSIILIQVSMTINLSCAAPKMRSPKCPSLQQLWKAKTSFEVICYAT